jgi:putative NADH-flavin reductase
MKIAVIGATGWIGGAVVNELLQRGHSVTALARTPGDVKTQHEKLTVARADLKEAESVAIALPGHDALVAAIASRKDAVPGFHVKAAKLLLDLLPRAGVKRFLWVGGAGSLLVAPNMRLVDTPDFPAQYKSEALAQAGALEVFRESQSPIDWVFLSPPAMIAPGKRHGTYRSGGDRLITSEKGESIISVEDFAVAIADELEKPKHHRARFTVAY